jgi:TP901 family phage tail tape measure protein
MPTIASFDVSIGADVKRFTKGLREVQRQLQAFKREADRDHMRKFRNDMRQFERDIDRFASKMGKGIKARVELDKSSLAAVREQIKREVVVPVRVRYVGSIGDGHIGRGRRGGFGMEAVGLAADMFDSRALYAAGSLMNRIPGGKIGMGLGLGALGAGGLLYGVPLAASFVGAPQSFAAARVQVRGNLTKAERQAFYQQAKSIAGSSMFSVKDVLGVQENLFASGFTKEQVRRMVPGIIKQAESTGDMDLDIASVVVGGLLRSFKMDASKSTYIADLIAQAANKSNMDTESFFYMNKYAAPTAASLRMPLKELTALQMAAENFGINKESAARYIGMGLGKLAKVPGAFKNGRLLPMEEILKNLHEQTKGMTDQEFVKWAKKTFGEEASRFWMQMIRNPELYSAMLGELDDSKIRGAADRAAQVFRDELYYKFQQLKEGLGNIMSSIFMDNEDWIRGAVNGAQKIVDRIQSIFDLKQTPLKDIKDPEIRAMAKRLQGESWFTTLMRGLFATDKDPFGDKSFAVMMSKAIEQGDWGKVGKLLNDKLLQAVNQMDREKWGEKFGQFLASVLGNDEVWTPVAEQMGRALVETLPAVVNAFGKGLGAALAGVLGVDSEVGKAILGVVGLFAAWTIAINRVIGKARGLIDPIKSVKNWLDRIKDKKIKMDVDESDALKDIAKIKAALEALPKKIEIDVVIDPDGKLGGGAGGKGKGKGGKGGKAGKGGGSWWQKLGKAGKYFGWLGGPQGIALGGWLWGLGEMDAGLSKDPQAKKQVQNGYFNAKAGGASALAASLGNVTKKANEATSAMNKFNASAKVPANKPHNLPRVKGTIDTTKVASDRLNESMKKQIQKVYNGRTISQLLQQNKRHSDQANTSMGKNINKKTNVDSITQKVRNSKSQSDFWNTSLGKTINKVINIGVNFLKGAKAVWDKLWNWHAGGLVPTAHGGRVFGAGSVPAMLWGGEMVLTQPQQKRLHDLLKYDRIREYQLQQALQAASTPQRSREDDTPRVQIVQNFYAPKDSMAYEARRQVERGLFAYAR